MYIGEEDNRGIAICPLEEKVPPQHAMLKAKPPQQPTAKVFFIPAPDATKDKNKSPNIVLIIASITAGILVTCVTLASAVKYLLKNNRYSKYFYAFHIPVPHFLSFIAFLAIPMCYIIQIMIIYECNGKHIFMRRVEWKISPFSK